MWYAKPRGAYNLTSDEAKANMGEIANYMLAHGYTPAAIAGVIGNSYGESGLNPWRWQSDTVNENAGYGLFQYTPASDYIDGCADVEGYAPNLSTTDQTDGAEASDGMAQVVVFDTNKLLKWVSTCWRPYWDEQEYSELYAMRQTILTNYGNGTRLSIEQFKTIDNVQYATFAFLACFEGPAVPNLQARVEYANIAYEYLFGETPPQPPSPSRKRMSIFMMIKYGL